MALLIFLLLGQIAYGAEKADTKNGLILELATIEAMVAQLEGMPRTTKDERDSWAALSMTIQDRIGETVCYEIRNNLDLWISVGRWAVAGGIERDKSPYANTPFFHIQRLRPNYQEDADLLELMAKLNAIRIKDHEQLTEDGFKYFDHLFEDSDTDSPRIQFRIGQAYDKGHGLWRNEHEAVKWYRRAAEAGNADALGELGTAYLYGQGPLENDDAMGEQLLLKAVGKGSASAAFTLGHYYRPSDLADNKDNREKCLEMFRIAAERSDYRAFSKVAEEYVNVGNGHEALRWANGGDQPDATADDDAHSQWDMRRRLADSRGSCSYVKGEVFVLGIGEIKQNLVKAKAQFEIASEKGSTKAMWALAAMYQEGIGVEASLAEATKWKERARSAFGITTSDYHNQQVRAFAERLGAAMP